MAVKIHTKIVIDMATDEVLEDEFYEHGGPVAEAKGGGGGGGATQTQTVQKADPWSGQQPFLTDIFGRAQTQYGTNLPFFPGQTFASPSLETNLALSAQGNRAISGSPLTNAAQTELTNTLSGQYLSGGNPAFSAMAERAISPLRSEFTNTIIPGIESRFAAAGRYGSPSLANTMGQAADRYMRAVGDVGASLAYQNYGDERTNQMRGMMFAPTLAQQDYFDIAKLAETGAAREDIAQQQINEDIARYNYNQMEPWQRLGLYSNLVQGYYGGQNEGMTTQTLPPRSIGAGMLGGAALGGGLGYLLGPQLGLGAGYGGLAGAGAGSLLGLF